MLLRDAIAHKSSLMLHSLAGEPVADSLGKAIATGIVGVLFLAVCAILRPHGLTATLCTVGLICSLVSTQLLMKELGSPPWNFNFPAWVTVMHFATVWLVCVGYWLWKGEPQKCFPSSMGSLHRYAVFIMPIAVSLPLSVVFNNTALLYLGAGLNSIVATLSPVTTAALANVMGRRIAKMAWLGVGMACLGAVVVAWGKLGHGHQGDHVAYGLVFSLAAVLLRSVKVVLQDQLLTPTAYAAKHDEKEALVNPQVAVEPMHVWALQGFPCAAVSVVYAAATEDVFLLASRIEVWTALMVLTTCLSACALNLLGMFVIKQLGAASMQIIGKLNTIMIVAFSIAFLHESLQGKVIAGTCLICTGVAIFEYAEKVEAQRASARLKGPILPSQAIKGRGEKC